MIIWIASYPKSGNTWLRTLISTYFFSKDGAFEDSLLKNIDQFPTKLYFQNFNHDKNIAGDTCKYWIKAQENINLNKKLKFWKDVFNGLSCFFLQLFKINLNPRRNARNYAHFFRHCFFNNCI